MDAVEENPFAKVRIVIVDDAASMRKTLLYMLRYLGYRNIAVAEDGKEAWEIITKERIDLVISDWNMPGMTGIELLYRIRTSSEYERLPFIMVREEMDEESLAQAAGIDLDSSILKPLVPKELEEKIALVLNNRNNPSDYQRHVNTARELVRENRSEEALSQYGAAIALDPERAMAYSFLAELHEQLSERDKARSAYEKAVSVNPRYIRALNGLTKIYSEEGSKEKLFLVLSLLIDISPEDPERLFILGKLAMEINNKERARSYLMQAVELEPHNEERLYEAAKLFLDSEMLDETEKLFDILMARSPRNYDYVNCSGDICRKRGKYDKARNLFMTALKLAEDETIHCNLARLYIDMGSRRLAEYHLEAALILDPDYSEAQELLDRLEELIAEVKAFKARI
jgi:two-component system chemotaxis response regulator CheY